jgi:hypothetical protein
LGTLWISPEEDNCDRYINNLKIVLIMSDVKTIEMISKKDLKNLTTASNLLNGKKDDLLNSEYIYDDAEENARGFKSYLYENKETGEVRRFNRNAFFFSDAVKVGVTIDNDTEYSPLYKLMLEVMGDSDEIALPESFKIVHVEDAQYTRDNGDKVTRYPLHFYKEFKTEMKDKNLTIGGIYSRPAAINDPFFANAKNWTVDDIHKANPDATVKKIKIQVII